MGYGERGNKGVGGGASWYWEMVSERQEEEVAVCCGEESTRVHTD